MNQAVIRPATSADMPGMFRVQMAGFGLDDIVAMIEPGETVSILRHGVATGRTSVAEQNGALGGFAISFERGDVTFLGHLFVNPTIQSAGLGRRLLGSVCPDTGRAVGTLGSDDRRGQALYIRAGMTPRWPTYMLSGAADDAQRLPDTGLAVIEADFSDEEWFAWDTEISGRQRRVDIEFLRRDWAGVPLWLEREGARVGYAQISQRYRGVDARFHAGSVTVGPVGARMPSDAAGCLIAAIQWAARQPGTATMQLDLPGPHRGIVPLLDAGFRIEEQQVFFASDPSPFGDPRLYVPATGALY